MFARLICITLSNIIKSFALTCKINLKKNEHINFTNCMDITMKQILKLLLYEADATSIINILRFVQLVRKTTIFYEPDRSFARVAVRLVFKWFHLKGDKKNNITVNSNG